MTLFEKLLAWMFPVRHPDFTDRWRTMVKSDLPSLPEISEEWG